MKAFATLCLLLAAVPAESQHSQPEPGVASAQVRKLTLRDALELADRQNLDLAAARQRRAVTQAGVQIARQIPNPNSSFGASRDFPHQSLLFEQPLEIGGKRQRRIELAKQQVTLTGLEIETFARHVRRRVRQAFFAAGTSRGLSAQRAQALELARRVRDTAQARFDAGDVPQLEVFQAELEVSRAQADLAVARQREKVAFSQLNALLNEPPETMWDTAGTLEDLPPQVALQDVVQRALESSAEIRHLLQEQRIEQSRRAWLQAERIPNLNVQFGSDLDAPGDFRVGPRGQLSLVVPLFTRNQGEIAQSLASQRALEGEVAAARRAVAARVAAVYFEWNARQTQVELFRRTLLPAGRRLQSLAEESYRAGKANLLTVLDAQRNVQQVERDYLESLLALQAAFADLEETVGASLD
ncbi:MAG: TolC family protein [Acidobacteria bacterium]|nr:TolC family protein [Acidobacteriota bacterium]